MAPNTSFVRVPPDVQSAKLEGLAPAGAERPAGPRRCFAQQFSDLMHCSPCNLVYETNDQYPPRCKVTGESCPANGAG